MFDGESGRDFPIKINQTALGIGTSINCYGIKLNETLIFPRVNVPKFSGEAFDFHPFPCTTIDEGETLVYSKGINDLPSQKWEYTYKHSFWHAWMDQTVVLPQAHRNGF